MDCVYVNFIWLSTVSKSNHLKVSKNCENGSRAKYVLSVSGL